MTTTNAFPTLIDVPPTPWISPATEEVTLTKKVYEVCQTMSGISMTTDDVAALMKGEATLNQVRGALIGMGKNPSEYPFLHRIERGVYLYEERRPRVWFSNPNNAKGARRAASKRRRNAAKAAQVAETTRAIQPTPSRPAVVEAKRPAESVVPTGALRPVEDAVVMADAAGNLFVVRVTPV